MLYQGCYRGRFASYSAGFAGPQSAIHVPILSSCEKPCAKIFYQSSQTGDLQVSHILQQLFGLSGATRSFTRLFYQPMPPPLYKCLVSRGLSGRIFSPTAAAGRISPSDLHASSLRDTHSWFSLVLRTEDAILNSCNHSHFRMSPSLPISA